MENRFVVLHLSDSHIGHPDRGLDSRSVLKPLIDDVAQIHLERGLQPNLVVFSGDLAFGHLPTSSLVEQYNEGRAFLSRVLEAAGVKLGNVPILIVPGNHDLNRTRIDASQTNWILAHKDEESDDAIHNLMAKQGVQWSRILERQEEYSTFVNELTTSELEYEKELNLLTGKIVHNGIKIGLAGFNSSWACAGDDDHGGLWIGRHQLQVAWEKLEDTEFRIAVAHHPVGWLSASDRRLVKERIQTHYRILFHGHEHSSWFSDSDGHLTIESGACYQGSTKENAYSWIEIDFDSKKANLHLRGWSDRGSGGWVDFQLPGKTTEKPGIYPLKHFFGEEIGSRASALAVEQRRDVPEIPNIDFQLQSHDLSNVLDLVRALEDGHGFRWEVGTIRSSDTDLLVYWPVRLRSPSVIHAVQAFAAAGLQRQGATVELCIDDLGNQQYSPNYLIETIRRWFGRVGGNPDTLGTTLFSADLGGENDADPWPQVQQWLGEADHLLEKVLKVSKLLGADTTLEQLIGKRPRRLLTPVVVWTVLMNVQRRAPTSSIITLSGYDERPLWQAWRECIRLPNVRIGHLYIPKLVHSDSGGGATPIHMEKVPLAWESKEDIRRDIESQLSLGPNGDSWKSENQIIPWCLQQCILLPEFITSRRVSRLASFTDDADATEIVGPLVDAVADWLLQDG